MNEPVSVALLVAECLERCGVSYLIGGSSDVGMRERVNGAGFAIEAAAHGSVAGRIGAGAP